MRFHTFLVRVRGYDPFRDCDAAAGCINIRAASAGYSSVPVGQSNAHCIEFLEREISECAPEIREKLFIEMVEEEVDE